MSDDPGAAPEAPPRGAEQPGLRIVRGTPDPAQLAALVVVLTAAAAAPAAEPSAGAGDPWRDHARRLGAPPSPGPGAWPTSARP